MFYSPFRNNNDGGDKTKTLVKFFVETSCRDVKETFFFKTLSQETECAEASLK